MEPFPPLPSRESFPFCVVAAAAVARFPEVELSELINGMARLHFPEE